MAEKDQTFEEAGTVLGTVKRVLEIPDNHVFGYKRIQDGEKDKLRISFLKTGNITIFLKRCKRLYSFDCGFSGMV